MARQHDENNIRGMKLNSCTILFKRQLGFRDGNKLKILYDKHFKMKAGKEKTH